MAKRKDARGKAVGVRGRDDKWFGFDWLPHESDELDCQRWQKMGAGIGIKTGNGLILIDADTLDETSARIIRDAITQYFGLIPARIGRHPKVGYPLRISEPMKYTRLDFGNNDRVEILSDGRQFVAHGVHATTGKPYTWPRPLVPFDQLPIVPAARVIAFLEELRTLLPAAAAKLTTEGADNKTEVNQDTLRGNLALVRKAVGLIPNTTDNFPTRESYILFGYAIKAALPDDPAEAFIIFNTWAAQWHDGERHNDPGVVEADWDRLRPPYRVGANLIYDLAEQHAPEQFSKAEVFFEKIDETENVFSTKILDNLLNTPGRFKFLSFDEAADSALSSKTAPLIKGLLDQGTMTVLYGDSNAGKTFATMDMAFHIAAGLPYAGMRTAKMPVAYIAAEGGHGARRRVLVLRDKYPEASKSAIFNLLLSAVDLRNPNADLKPLIADLHVLIEKFGPLGLLVIDTLSRALAGGDENSSVDMGLLVRNLDTLRAATGAHLLVVHHTGKDRARGARGHSILRAATDTEIEVADRRITVTKQRDLETAWTSEFELEVRVVGLDSDGEPLTSCTVKLGARAVDTGDVVLSAVEQDVLDALNVCQETSERGDGASVDDLIEYMDGKIAKNAMLQHLKRLTKKKLVKKPKRGKWALEVVKNGLTTSINVVDYKNEMVKSGRPIGQTVFE